MRVRKLLALAGATLALGLVAGCGGDDDEGGSQAQAGGSQEQAGGTIKIGFLSDCEGAFGSFFEPTAAGFNLALIKWAGGTAGRREADRRRHRREDRAARTWRSSATAARTTPPTRRSRRRAA